MQTDITFMLYRTVVAVVDNNAHILPEGEDQFH